MSGNMGKLDTSKPQTDTDKEMSKRHTDHREEIDKMEKKHGKEDIKVLKKSLKYNKMHAREHMEAASRVQQMLNKQ